MDSKIVYTKDDQIITVSQKFIYCSSVYRIWKRGAYLMDEKRYASTTPLNIKKSQKSLKKNGYIIQRFFELESAPEEYLINKGYKLKKL